MKAIKIKNWCLENITPQSWSRIVLRTLPQLREHNLDLNEIENPGDDLELNEEVMQILAEQGCVATSVHFGEDVEDGDGGLDLSTPGIG